MSTKDEKKAQIRELAESDLLAFIRLVHPQRVLGSAHEEVIQWWQDPDRSPYNLLLLPRDHQKSALAAYRVAQRIVKQPDVRVLYISSTANLAIKQLNFIKGILESDIVRYYWPELINKEESKREKWTETEIAVDHPKRKAEAVRDPTVFTAGLTTNITGMHCDVAVFDDVVVPGNAYTEEGREKVAQQYSQLASIQGTDSEQWVVGTRYHPKDLYQTMQELIDESADLDLEEGDILAQKMMYDVFQREVEDRGDGTGEFLWPRMQRNDGKWFGFDAKILARKRQQYVDKTQFRAQYYNSPNDLESAPIKSEYFQYYNRGLIKIHNRAVYYNNQRLNVFASVDFAYSLTKKADFTAIVVVGVDANQNYYVLDISRFKTDQISEYYKQIAQLHTKWGFSKIRAETTAAQKLIIRDLKDNYIRKHGLALTIDENSPSRHQGSKEERMDAALRPRYESRQIWHYKGGNCEILEEELVQQRPAHDDIKDSLASCFDICVAPSFSSLSTSRPWEGRTSSRFGGLG